MSLRSWWQKRKNRRRIADASKEMMKNASLREFVYLDAVSLHSLLVSQNATIPNEVSQAISRADEAEITGTIKADALAVKAETAARYQTSNSNSVQSSRKAVIQTLFKELRDLPLDFKLAAREAVPEPLADVTSIVTASDPQSVEPASGFTRGTLVEIAVTLAVDPVFKLGAMMTEWSAMADEYPAMFGAQGTLGFLREAQPIMKVLDRFLAGLIPIKATAVNHVVAEIDGEEFVVHKTAIEGLKVKTRPLNIVGVTEHIGYWKDIRRVLFSEARFTILGRVARDGIHEKWTPVKLADLFSEVAPGFVDQVNAIRAPSASDVSDTSLQSQQTALGEALVSYRTELIAKIDAEWPLEADAVFDSLKARLQGGSTSVAAQRHAFDQVRDLVTTTFGTATTDADTDLGLRQAARARAGLELFPSLGASLSPTTEQFPEVPEKPDERMIDVEVIAIYW